MSSSEGETPGGNENQPLQRSWLMRLAKEPFSVDACSTYQPICYMHYLRSRPLVNPIYYLRLLVVEFYDLSFDVTEMWCFSSCKSTDQDPVYNKLARKCSLCGLRTGKQVVGNGQSMPRLHKTKFEHGVLDEILHLNPPTIMEILPSGLVSVYEKVVRELVYQNYRVVHQGKLRVMHTDKLKLVSWEFCAQNSEIFCICQPRPGLNLNGNPNVQIVSIAENGLKEHSQTTLQEGMFSDSFKLAEEFGLPRGYCIASEMTETVQLMKDIMDFSIQHKLGPIASLQQIVAEANWGKRFDTPNS